MTALNPETIRVIEYRASGAAAALFECHAAEILIEGPAGTGKTRAVLEKLNLLCESYAGVRVLLLRATRTRLTESVLVTLEDKVFWPGHPAMTGDAGRGNRHEYVYPNGSTLVCGGLDDGDRWFSTEWDLIYLAEATEATLDQWEKLGRAMRNKSIPRGVSGGPILLHDDGTPAEAQAMEDVEGQQRPAYFRQRIADCNPSYPSHWLNQRADAGKMVRLVSRHQDNPSLDKGYLSELSNLTGHRRARLFDGRWASAEGSVYPDFDEKRHVIRAVDSIPGDGWPVYLGYDPGFDHPTAVLWFTVSPNETVYVIDEIYRGGLGVEEHADNIRARQGRRNVVRYYGDPQHMFSSTAQSPETIAEKLAKKGFRFERWPRTAGNEEAMVESLRKLLRQDRFKVFDTCVNTIREFQSWSYKRTASGELPSGGDQFEDKNNHAMDVIKGVIATRPCFTQAGVQVIGAGGTLAGAPQRISLGALRARRERGR